MNINIYIHSHKDKRRNTRQLLWEIGPVSEQATTGTTRRRKKMLKLTTTQQSALAISGVDRKGQPAGLDSIVFSSSDPSVATVTPDASDPSKAILKAVAAGTTQINVTADADLGDGVNELTGVLDVNVVAGQAVSLAISTGTVEEQA